LDSYGLGTVRLNASFVYLFILDAENVSVGMAGLDHLTVWYIHLIIWSRRLFSSLFRLMSLSEVVTDPGCLQW